MLVYLGGLARLGQNPTRDRSRDGNTVAVCETVRSEPPQVPRKHGANPGDLGTIRVHLRCRHVVATKDPASLDLGRIGLPPTVVWSAGDGEPPPTPGAVVVGHADADADVIVGPLPSQSAQIVGVILGKSMGSPRGRSVKQGDVTAQCCWQMSQARSKRRAARSSLRIQKKMRPSSPHWIPAASSLSTWSNNLQT